MAIYSDVYSEAAHRALEDALARIPKGLETQLRERVGIRLRSQAFLFDPERIARLSLIRIAGETSLEAPEIYSGTWIDERIDEAVRATLQQDAEDELEGVVIGEERDDSAYAFMLDSLGIPMEQTRGAVVRFNVLPYSIRKPFVEVAVVGKHIKECIEEGLGSEEEILESLRTALSALGMLGSFDKNEGPA